MTHILGQTKPDPWYARVLLWLIGLPRWITIPMLCVALMVGTVIALNYTTAASAAEVKALEGRVRSVEAQLKHDKEQLDRIERKLDQLILKLIGKD